VRTAEEWALCRIEGATWIPLTELPGRVDELDRAREIVVYCHVGGRSARAVRELRARGFARATSLAGGIRAWAASVDPSVPRY
jgi:adenylyltransferase/sulfurtransferase